MSERIHLGFVDREVEVGLHAAYLWRTTEEFDRAVRFLDRGLRDGHHCVVFGHAEANQRVRTVLRDRGHDFTGLVRAGRMSLMGGSLSASTLFSSLILTVSRALDHDFPVVRILGNLGWHQERWPSADDLLELETDVGRLVRNRPVAVLCLYDHSLPSEILDTAGRSAHGLVFEAARLDE